MCQDAIEFKAVSDLPSTLGVQSRLPKLTNFDRCQTWWWSGCAVNVRECLTSYEKLSSLGHKLPGNGNPLGHTTDALTTDELEQLCSTLRAHTVPKNWPMPFRWYLADLWTMSYKQTLQHAPCLQIYITSEIIICSDPCECWFSIPNHTRTKIWSYLTDETTCRTSDVDSFRAWGSPAREYRSWCLYSRTNFFSRPTGRSWITYTYRCRIVFKNHCLLNIILGSMQFYRKTLLLLCTSVGDPCVSCFNHKLNPYLLL